MRFSPHLVVLMYYLMRRIDGGHEVTPVVQHERETKKKKRRSSWEWLTNAAWSVFLIRPPRERGDEYNLAVMTLYTAAATIYPLSIPSGIFWFFSCLSYFSLNFSLPLLTSNSEPNTNNLSNVSLIEHSQHHGTFAIDKRNSMATSINVGKSPWARRQNTPMIHL